VSPALEVVGGVALMPCGVRYALHQRIQRLQRVAAHAVQVQVVGDEVNQRVGLEVALVAQQARQRAVERLAPQVVRGGRGQHARLRVYPRFERVLLQDTAAEGMHRVDVRALDAGAGVVQPALLQLADDARLHLGGGGAREGNRQDVFGRNATLGDQMHEPLGQHARLARPCARDDRQ
jgi:hypothetical protein